MEVGFSSVGTFSALFARRVGATPSSYQRDVRPPDAAPGCLTLMGMLPEGAHRKFEEARAARRSKIPPCASS
jgi:AraC-like DNA-binding protein